MEYRIYTAKEGTGNADIIQKIYSSDSGLMLTDDHAQCLGCVS